MTAAKPATPSKKERAKHITKKGLEPSSLAMMGVGAIGSLAVAGGLIGSAENVDLQEAIGNGAWLAALPIVVGAALRMAPSVLARFGFTRTADAFTAARAPDSPGGEDVTVGEMVDIGEAAAIDAGMREARGDQRGDDD